MHLCLRCCFSESSARSDSDSDSESDVEVKRPKKSDEKPSSKSKHIHKLFSKIKFKIFDLYMCFQLHQGLKTLNQVTAAVPVNHARGL